MPNSNKVLVIDASIPTWRSYFREIYRYREVGRVLVRRDMIVRFRQTLFGIAWLLFKPLMMMLVISIAFGFIGRFEKTSAAPYPLVILCGVIPWYFFTNAVPDGIHSIVGHLHIIQKTYFPRIIIPLVAISINTVELFVACLLFAAICVWFRFMPSVNAVWLPIFFVLLIAMTTGLALWLSLLHARFRDVGNLVPFIINVGFFVTPIGYTLQSVPTQWQAFFSLNPLVGIIEGIRWSLLANTHPFPLEALVFSLVWSIGLAGSGLWYFRRYENAIVDFA